MLTPVEIKEHEFKAAGRNAYRSDDVDEFFAQLFADYEKMFHENGELVKRVSLLADRLEQFRSEENEIKNAVISAQKAADLIVKQAENDAEDSKAEAESILAAAKGEVDIIKSDASKKATEDSEKLLALAREKAEEILKQAQENAGSIVMDARSSAKDKVGLATRTVTSETILYDMLKKEVADFRANILAQYRTHIELISKLPELAATEAREQEASFENAASSSAENTQPTPAEETDDETAEDDGSISPLIQEVEGSDDALEYVDETEADEKVAEVAAAGEEGESVIHTTLPYDFFGDDPDIEFVSPEAPAKETSAPAEPEKRGFSVGIGHMGFSADDIADEKAKSEPVGAAENADTASAEDVPISKSFSVDKGAVVFDDIGSFEFPDESNDLTPVEKGTAFSTISDSQLNDADNPPEKHGFFHHKKEKKEKNNNEEE